MLLFKICSSFYLQHLWLCPLTEFHFVVDIVETSCWFYYGHQQLMLWQLGVRHCIWHQENIPAASLSKRFLVCWRILLEHWLNVINDQWSDVIGMLVMSVSCSIQKICGLHKRQICSGNMVQNCSKPTTSSHSTGVQTHEWQSHICIKLTCLACTLCYSCGQQSYAYD